MMIAQRSVGYSLDPYAVRPGTSAALTARTIDATQRPPLVKAQEAVASAVPRIIDSVPPPLIGGTLGIAVLAVMVASQRVRFRLAPVLASAVLLLPVSNYHAAQKPAEVQAVVPDDAPHVEDYPGPSHELVIPPEIIDELAPLADMVVPEEWTDEEQLRVLRRKAERLMEEIRKLRLEQELEERRQSLSYGLFQ